MKIVRYSQNGHAPRLGCFVGGDRVMDLAASAAAHLASRGVVRAEAIADALVSAEHAGIPRGRRGQPGHADRHARRVQERQVRRRHPHPPARSGCTPPSTTPASSSASGSTTRIMRRRPTIPPPSSRRSSPSGPIPSSIRASPILRPRGEKTLDWEVELGVVIGRTARFVPQEKGARLRVRLHDRQRLPARATSSSTPRSGAPARWRHPGPGGPVHRRPRGDPGSACPRPQDLGQRRADAEREHPELHLRRSLRHHVPHQHHDAVAGRPHRHRHSPPAWASRASPRSRCNPATP
jgi:hypothetical protein